MAPLEGNVKGGGDAALGRFGSTHVGTYRDKHSDKAGQAGKNGTDSEADGRFSTEGGKKGDKHNDTDGGDDGILALHVRTGTLLNRCRNLFHPVITLGQAKNPIGCDQAVGYGCCGTGQGKNNCILFHFNFLL